MENFSDDFTKEVLANLQAEDNGESEEEC